MELSYCFILLILVVIVILEFAKYTGVHKGKKAYDMGISMTIGSREVQEDQADTLVIEAGIMAVLADGMGKTFGGRIAAKTAVNTFVEIFKDYNAFHNPQYFFRKAFHAANKEILKAVGDEYRGAASVSCALIRNGYLYYAVVGNVRIYVCRDGNLIPVSSGHTVAVLAEKGFQEGKITREEALAALDNARVYNYVGRDGFRDIEIFDAPVKLKSGDMVALMSNGIYELLSWKEIEEILSHNTDCQGKAFEIIEAVNRNFTENKDNASIVLLETEIGAGE